MAATKRRATTCIGCATKTEHEWKWLTCANGVVYASAKVASIYTCAVAAEYRHEFRTLCRAYLKTNWRESESRIHLQEVADVYGCMRMGLILDARGNHASQSLLHPGLARFQVLFQSLPLFGKAPFMGREPQVCLLPVKFTPGCPGPPSAPPTLKCWLPSQTKLLGSPAVSVGRGRQWLVLANLGNLCRQFLA
eukprot:1157532-Pelagomonas_calceolata.AAC.8